MTESNILMERDGSVGIVALNRPEVLNALDQASMEELADALETLDRDEEIRCIVVTGNERFFGAGADVNEMADATAVDMVKEYRFVQWQRIRSVATPIIAAVSGYCLGGANELAMACDLIIASESALFGQPEINIGVIPGAGGTQRLTRAAGKSVSMELILTGRAISAHRAHELGLVSRVVPDELYLDEALRLAREIAEKPPVAVRMAKQAILQAFETALEAGLEFERRAFHLLFASEDKTEGIRAFLEKRPPQWLGR
ncbi:MAG: enoyl-CoA hydratase-related protein [Acidobacteriota bacterium]